MATCLDELSCQLLVLEVEQIVWLQLGVEITLVVFELSDAAIVQVLVVVPVIHI